MVRSGRCMLRDLVPLLASRGLHLRAKDKFILHVYVALRFMEVRLGQLKRNKLERNYARMVR